MTADRRVPGSVLDNVVASRHTRPGRIGRLFRSRVPVLGFSELV